MQPRPEIVTRLREDIQNAKKLMKRGRFRQFSASIRAIIDKPEYETWLRGSSAEEEQLQIQVCRLKVLIYQHLDYYDALLHPLSRSIDDLQTKHARFGVDGIEFNSLVENVNYLREFKIVTASTIITEGEEAFSLISWALHNSRVNWKWMEQVHRELWRERAWVALVYCQELFQAHEVSMTIEKLEQLRRFVFDRLSTNEFPCNATKASLVEELARAYRRAGRYQDAENCYNEAIGFYLKKTLNPKSQIPETEEQTNNARRYQYRRVAQVYAYGIQQIHASKSDLKRSEAAIRVAQLLLSNENADEITLRFIELSKGIILRISAGNKKKSLEDAREIIDGARKYFEEIQHERLLYKCKWEMAIIDHLLNDPKVEEVIASYKEYCHSKNDIRALANVDILKSHIERRNLNYHRARDLANGGLAQAEESKNTIAIKDAHIAVGESLYQLEKTQRSVEIDDAGRLHGERMRSGPEYQDPVAAFEKALDINRSHGNQKIEAICFLGLSKVAAIRNDKTTSDIYWERYLQLKQAEQIQHRFIIDVLEAEASADRARMQPDFIIRSSVSINKENYLRSVDSLWQWFYEKGKRLGYTDKTLAGWFGVSRTTVNQRKKRNAKKEPLRRVPRAPR